jgi:hypothetical protein
MMCGLGSRGTPRLCGAVRPVNAHVCPGWELGIEPLAACHNGRVNCPARGSGQHPPASLGRARCRRPPCSISSKQNLAFPLRSRPRRPFELLSRSACNAPSSYAHTGCASEIALQTAQLHHIPQPDAPHNMSAKAPACCAWCPTHTTGWHPSTRLIGATRGRPPASARWTALCAAAAPPRTAPGAPPSSPQRRSRRLGST